MFETIIKSDLETLLTNESTCRFLLLDVREPSEYSSSELPAIHKNARNVPVQTIKNVFEMNCIEFMEHVGQEKPSMEEKIIIYCRSGRRAVSAAEHLSNLKFSNLVIYPGSAIEWHSQT